MTVKRPEYLNRPSHEHPIFHGGWQEVHKVANELWQYALQLEAELSDAAHALVEDDSARLNVILRARYRKES